MSSPSRLRALVLAALLLGVTRTLAWALAVDVAAPRIEDGQVWATVRLLDPLDARIERTLRRGAPATLTLHAELWRRRSGWFGRLEHSADASMRLRYLVSRDAWAIDRPGVARVTLPTPDSLAIVLSKPLSLPVARADDLAPGARYVIVVTVTMKPLSVEDLEEVDIWLRGEAREQSASGAGVITTLPRSVFDALRGVVGFGDRRTRGTGPEFVAPEPR